LELENTVDFLKSELTLQVAKNAQMLEWMKTFNSSLEEKTENNFNNKMHEESVCFEISKSEVNLSGEMTDSILIVDKDQELQIMNITQSPKQEQIEKEQIQDIINKNEENFNINQIRIENLELIKENEKLRNLNLNKNLKINKLQTDKLILINELQELLNSLSRVDMKSLNKFFSENCSGRKLDVPSSLGVKYNILSTYSCMSLMLRHKEDSLNIKNYQQIFRSYEDEFERLINKNLTLEKLLLNSDEE
jgi:hypothetical protein